MELQLNILTDLLIYLYIGLIPSLLIHNALSWYQYLISFIFTSGIHSWYIMHLTPLYL